MTLSDAAIVYASILGSAALLAVCWRLLRGPSLADRVIALDMLGLIAVAVAALTAAITRHHAFFDVAFGFALLGFLTTVAFAGLLERAARPSPAGGKSGASS